MKKQKLIFDYFLSLQIQQKMFALNTDTIPLQHIPVTATKKQKRRKCFSTSASIRRQKERSKRYYLNLVAKRELVMFPDSLRYNVKKLQDEFKASWDETNISYHMCDMSNCNRLFVVIDKVDGSSYLVRNWVWRPYGEDQSERTRFYTIHSNTKEFYRREYFLIIPFDPFVHLQQQYRINGATQLADSSKIDLKYQKDIVHQIPSFFRYGFAEIECTDEFIYKYKESLENVEFNTIKLKVVDVTGLYIGGHVMLGGITKKRAGKKSISDDECDDNESIATKYFGSYGAKEDEEDGDFIRVPYNCMLSITPMPR